jgi:5-methylcytosine-specific restriction enzyme B
MTTAALEADFAAYNAEEDRLAKAHHLRTQFIERFPVEVIPTLTLKQYALGAGDPESFCQWLEFKTMAVGSISGAVASKHVVFYSKKRTEWVYPPQFGSETEALQAVLAGISKLISLASQGLWDSLDKVEPFAGRNLTRGKILYMYYPDAFVPIFAPSQLSALRMSEHTDFSE